MKIREEIQKRQKQQQRAYKSAPKPAVSTYYKLHLEYEQFIVMLNYTIEKEYDIHEYINKWWNTAFPEKQFPEGRTLQELKIAIQYGLIFKAYNESKIKPKERFIQNYQKAINFQETLITRCERENKLSKTIILKKEFEMATKKKEKNIVSPNKPKEKVKKAPKPNQFSIITDALLERKYTDQQIVDKVKAVFPNGGADLSWVQSLRNQLNNGKRRGHEKADPVIVKIGGKKKKEKEAAVKPKAKEKAATPKKKAKKK